MKLTPIIFALLVVCAATEANDGWIFGAKDETPPPFPTATIADYVKFRTFSEPPSLPPKMTPRFFIVDAEGKSIPDIEGMSGFFRSRYVSKTLAGARTVVFVRFKTEQFGEWVTVFTKERIGDATSIAIEACCIDMSNPSNIRILKGDSTPLPGAAKEPFRFTSPEGKVIRVGQYQPGQLLQELFEDILK